MHISQKEEESVTRHIQFQDLQRYPYIVQSMGLSHAIHAMVSLGKIQVCHLEGKMQTTHEREYLPRYSDTGNLHSVVLQSVGYNKHGIYCP